jgi:hypothetical protein
LFLIFFFLKDPSFFLSAASYVSAFGSKLNLPEGTLRTNSGQFNFDKVTVLQCFSWALTRSLMIETIWKTTNSSNNVYVREVTH